MPKKKRVTKKRSASKSSRSMDSKKINMVLRRFIFFLILFVLSLVLYFATSNELWEKFFGILSSVFGFISVALLIVLLVLWFMGMMKKK